MNELAILIGLISFPGLLATMLCDAILVHVERWATFKYAIYTFTFGVVSYVALQFIVWAGSLYALYLPFLAHQASLQLWSTLVTGNDLRFSEVVWASIIAPIIALSTSIVVNKKWLHRFSQWIRISNKYGDENLFSYFLNSQDVSWVYVRCRKDGLTYLGKVRAFSECREVQEILLTNVSVFDYYNSTPFYDLDSIYLTKPLGSFVIELPSSKVEDASNE